MSTPNQILDLKFEYEDRLITDQLGKNKYNNPINALSEEISTIDYIKEEFPFIDTSTFQTDKKADASKSGAST